MLITRRAEDAITVKITSIAKGQAEYAAELKARSKPVKFGAIRRELAVARFLETESLYAVSVP